MKCPRCGYDSDMSTASKEDVVQAFAMGKIKPAPNKLCAYDKKLIETVEKLTKPANNEFTREELTRMVKFHEEEIAKLKAKLNA